MELKFRLTGSEKALINVAFKRYNDLRCNSFIDDNHTDHELIEIDEKIRKSFSSTSHPNKIVEQRFHFHDPDNHVFKDNIEAFMSLDLFKRKRCKTSKQSLASQMDPPFEKRFNLLKKFCSFQQYKNLLPFPLIKRWRRMNFRERLLWMIHLLVYYHYEHECSIYISLALKISLRAFQLIINCSSEKIKDFIGYPHRFSTVFASYLTIMEKHKCSELLVISALRLFCADSDQKVSFFLRVDDLKYVLECIGKTTLRLPFILQKEPGQIHCSDLCLKVNLASFAVLVTFGISSIYTEEDWQLFKWSGMSAHDNDVINSNCIMPAHGRCNLRLNQIIDLFGRSQRGKTGREVFCLKLLWASISEPFITEKDVAKYLKEPIYIAAVYNKKYARYFRIYYTSEERCALQALYNDTPDPFLRLHEITEVPCAEGTPRAVIVLQAWQWYKETALYNSNPLRSPRSLQHLCRCVVRRDLAINFLLPKGVHLLNLPEPINKYLLLSECGDNPFEVI